jgi:hypothetical protein
MNKQFCRHVQTQRRLVKDKNMKKTIAILSLSAVAAASVQTASAGDREWATVGKVLTGIAAVHVLSHALHPPPFYAGDVVYARPPVYAIAPTPRVPVAPIVAPAPVYFQPAPLVVYPQPVIVAPPVYVTPRFCAPPVLSVNLGFGHPHRGGHRHGW